MCTEVCLMRNDICTRAQAMKIDDEFLQKAILKSCINEYWRNSHPMVNNALHYITLHYTG